MEKLIVTRTPESSGSSTFPTFARFYSQERNLLSYSDGAVPFFLNLDSSSIDDESILELSSSLFESRRVPRGFVFDKFYVYKLDDYGAQSLSPGREDFNVLCFVSSGSSSGYKVPQKDVAIIRNFTTKESFVLVPKASISSGNITVLILPTRQFQSSEERVQLTKSGSVFQGNLSSIKADSLDEIAVYAREGSTDFEITNSEDFVSLTRPEFPEIDNSNTFVAQQGSYFKKLQNSESISKARLNTVATIDIGIAGSSAYASTKQHGTDHYYGTLSSLNSNQSSTIASRGIYELYEEHTNGLMKKLIQGKHYWVGSDGQLNIDGSTSTKRYEVFIKKERARKIVSSFDFSTGNSYDLHEALYYAYIKDWKVDKDNSRIRIYKDGLLVKSHNASGSYTEYTFTAGTYEYIVEDYSFDESVSTPTSDDNDVTFHYSIAGVQARTSLEFNKYQVSTDRHLTTDGTGMADRSEQDVFLYNTADGFLKHSDEPKVTNSAGSITVQGVADPYATGSFLTGVRDNYQDFQDVFESGKTKVTKAIHDNTRVQQIEAGVSQLKKNLKAILDNSTLSLSSYSSQVSAGQFMFLLLKGTAGQKFDLAYKDGSTVVKKEHDCTFDSDGRYVSVPFFFDTFGNSRSSVSFEVTRGSVAQYYIFR
jgi:hypothetical protein